MEIIRGQKIKLSDLTPSLHIEAGVYLNYAGPGSVDITCFGVDSDNKLSDDRYFVFFNQHSSPQGEIRKLGAGSGDTERFDIELSRLPAKIVRLVFTAAIDGAGTMAQLSNGYFRLQSDGREIARFPFTGGDFTAEKAIVIAEVYLKDIWRFAAVGQGFSGGLSALLKHYGGEEASTTAPPQPPVPPQPPIPPQPTVPPQPPVPPAPSVPVPPPTINLKKVTLDKAGQSQKVELRKMGKSDPFHVNLNWDQKVKLGGIFGGTVQADLDLGCMVEMSDGTLAVIQALGNRFGSRTDTPYILLDKDDRSGAAGDGENLYICRPDLIERVMVFAFIYEGAARYQDVNGRITIKDESGNEIYIPLNAPDSQKTFCAICTLTRSGDSLTITKEERYFKNHQEADQHYGFGFRWSAGRK